MTVKCFLLIDCHSIVAVQAVRLPASFVTNLGDSFLLVQSADSVRSGDPMIQFVHHSVVTIVKSGDPMIHFAHYSVVKIVWQLNVYDHLPPTPLVKVGKCHHKFMHVMLMACSEFNI